MATGKAIDPRVLAALAAQQRAKAPQEDPRTAAMVQRARAQQMLQGRPAAPPSQLPQRPPGMKKGGKVRGSGAEIKGKTKGKVR